MKLNGKSFTHSFGLSTAPVPVEPYISKDYFELERERVFKRSWLCVGRVEDISQPGDYFVRDLPILRTSIIVVRGQDGAIRAFHNMCQHRGNKLAGTGGTHGNVSAFTCCFHGWRYDLDGKLAYIPDEQSFFDLDKSKLKLMPLASDSWEGFIFVNASLTVGETVDQWIGEMAPLVKGFDFSFPLAGHYRTDLRCNWKIVLDSVQEAYHVVALHRRTVASAFAAKENPFAHLTSARMFKRHRSVSVWGNPKVKPRPSESLALKLARLSSPYTPSINQTNHPGLNPEQDNNWAFDIHVLFPNLQIILGEGYYLTQWAWPVAVDQTRYEVKMYMKPPAVPSESIMQEFNKVMLYDVLLEDLFTLENTQASLSSGVKTELNFSDQEVACRHSYEVIDAMIRG